MWQYWKFSTATISAQWLLVTSERAGIIDIYIDMQCSLEPNNKDFPQYKIV
jgi:hypothetical protein